MRTSYTWVTRENESFPIEEMQLSHIMNSLRYFSKINTVSAKVRTTALLKELFRRDLLDL